MLCELREKGVIVDRESGRSTKKVLFENVLLEDSPMRVTE